MAKTVAEKAGWPVKPPSGTREEMQLAIDCIKLALDILRRHYPKTDDPGDVYEPLDPPEDPPDSPPAQPTAA